MDESIMEIIKTIIGVIIILMVGFAAIIPFFDVLAYLSSF